MKAHNNNHSHSLLGTTDPYFQRTNEIQTDSTDSDTVKTIPATSNNNEISRKHWWITYLCFLTMTTLVFVPTGFYQASSNDMLGKIGADGVKYCSLAQFVTAAIMSTTITHWRKWGNVNQRLTFSITSYLITISMMLYVYPRHREVEHFADISNDHQTESTFLKVLLIFCIIVNQIAFQCGEITMMEKVANYHKSCTNAVSTGAGLGAIAGNQLGTFVKEPIKLQYLIAILYIVPLILPLFWFWIIPQPAKVTTTEVANEKTENSQTSHAGTGGEVQTQSSLNSVEDGLDVEAQSATKQAANDIQGNETEQEQAEESIYTKQLNILQALKLMFLEFTKYTLPMFGSYFLWEIARNGVIVYSYRATPALGKIFRQFGVFHRIGSFVGKASTNFWSTKRLYMFPLLIMLPVMWMALVLFLKKDVKMFQDFVNDHQWPFYLAIGLPIGFLYGSTSANVFYAIREDVKEDDKRRFLLSNIKQGQSFGQLGGALLSIPWEYIVKATVLKK